jgi:hypothetical protein
MMIPNLIFFFNFWRQFYEKKILSVLLFGLGDRVNQDETNWILILKENMVQGFYNYKYSEVGWEMISKQV